MATVRVHLVGEQLGPQLQKFAVRTKKRVNAAANAAAADVVAYTEPRLVKDVTSAGRFGARWAPTGKVTKGGGFIRINFTASGKPPMRFWRVFEHGAIIKGKPLLWIPLSFAKDAQGIRARDYPGKLFRVNRVGKAPLLAVGKPFAPKYFGIASVKIPKKFHLRAIIKEGAQKLKLFFSQRMKSNG